MLFGDMSDRMHLDQFRHVFLKIVQSKCYRQSLAALLLSLMYVYIYTYKWYLEIQAPKRFQASLSNCRLQTSNHFNG